MATLRESIAELLAGDQAHLNPTQALSDLALGLQGQKAGRSALLALGALRAPPAHPARHPPVHNQPGLPRTGFSGRLLADLDPLIQIAQDPSRELEAMVPWGSGQTLMRELLLAADHNSYHLGQIECCAGSWGPSNR